MLPRSHHTDGTSGASFLDPESSVATPSPSITKQLGTEVHISPTASDPHEAAGFWRTWAWELSSAALLLISIAAFPATLVPHAGQPLPQWPFSITINALLSVYSMVLKACIAFIVASCIGQLQWSWFLEPRPLGDLVSFHDAGEGPWGSLSWLWKHRLRQPLTALGAAITIIAMAIDPFIQQLVQPIDCTETLSKDLPASVPRTNYFADQSVSSSMQSYLTAGFYSFQNLSDYSCETGNCTFKESYSTLGFCSQCSDRSGEVTLEKHCSVSESKGGKITHSPGACDTTSYNNGGGQQYTTSWNLTTSSPPYDLDFFYQTQNLTVGDDGMYQYPTPDVFSMQAGEKTGEIHESDPDFMGKRIGVVMGLTDSAILRTDPTAGTQNLTGCDDSATNNTWYCRGYGAAECLLQPCIRTYSTSIDAGRINEQTIETSDLDLTWGWGEPGTTVNGITMDKRLFGVVDKTCINVDERQKLTAAGYSVDESNQRWLPYNITFDPSTTTLDNSSSFPQSLLAHDCLYLIDAWLILHLWDSILSPLVLGTVTREMDEGGATAFSYTFNGSQPLLQLYNGANVSMTALNETFANLAQAMTLYIRENGADGFSKRAEGDVLHYAVCIQVTWAWIALPAAVAGLALLMLMFTTIVTAKNSLPPWKAHPLPVLLRGPAGTAWVDEDMVVAKTGGMQASTDVDTVNTMSRYAEGVYVRLVGQDGQHHLRQVAPRSHTKAILVG